MNYEESEQQPANNRITRSKATIADLLVFESLLPEKKKLLNLGCVHPPPPISPEGRGVSTQKDMLDIGDSNK